MADEFRGGTSAGGVTGDVTGLELAKVCQQSYMSVTGCNNSSVSNQAGTMSCDEDGEQPLWGWHMLQTCQRCCRVDFS